MPASSDGGDAATLSTVVADGGTASPAPDPRLIADLVTANHILYDQHVVDAFGHVSVRHDKHGAGAGECRGYPRIRPRRQSTRRRRQGGLPRTLHSRRNLSRPP